MNKVETCILFGFTGCIVALSVGFWMLFEDSLYLIADRTFWMEFMLGIAFFSFLFYGFGVLANDDNSD